MAKIKVVHGAPCSGKTTYVAEHTGNNDVVWDYDSIRQALILGDDHDRGTDEQNDMVLNLRRAYALAAADSGVDTAWFCCTHPTRALRELLGEAEYIHMDATKEECLERLENDDTRKDKEFMRELIEEYFSEEERAAKMDGKKEIRAFDFEVRAEENEEHGHFLSGHPIVYGAATELYDPIIGHYTEIIDDGALDGTDLRDVRFLVNHNTDMIPLARSRNNNENSTMQFVVLPDVGMQIRVDLDTENNAYARSLYSAVQRGDISGMSYMYTVEKERWEGLDDEKPTRHILGISKVFEVSAVTFPAYSATSIQARGLSDALESARASLESARAEQREIERRKQKIRILTEV